MRVGAEQNVYNALDSVRSYCLSQYKSGWKCTVTSSRVSLANERQDKTRTSSRDLRSAALGHPSPDRRPPPGPPPPSALTRMLPVGGLATSSVLLPFDLEADFLDQTMEDTTRPAGDQTLYIEECSTNALPDWDLQVHTGTVGSNCLQTAITIPILSITLETRDKTRNHWKYRGW